MATELIRIDVIEHVVSKTGGGKIKKGGGDGKSVAKTPEELRQAAAKKEARAKAKAARQHAQAVRNTIVYGAMAVRKFAQVGGEVANMILTQSFTRQIFDAQMMGDTRKSQLLQNQKTKISSTTTLVTTSVNNAASTAAGFAINPVLGTIQVMTYMTQFSIDLLNKMQTHAENMRQYKLQADRQLAQTEYARKRLLLNTFNNRGFL